MTLSQAEKAVVIARRRKKNARPGYRQEAAIRLKMAVTEALRTAAWLRAHLAVFRPEPAPRAIAKG